MTRPGGASRRRSRGVPEEPASRRVAEPTTKSGLRPRPRGTVAQRPPPRRNRPHSADRAVPTARCRPPTSTPAASTTATPRRSARPKASPRTKPPYSSPTSHSQAAGSTALSRARPDAHVYVVADNFIDDPRIDTTRRWAATPTRRRSLVVPGPMNHRDPRPWAGPTSLRESGH